MVAAGGLYTSVTDACRFLQLHLAGGAPLLPASLLGQMYRPPFAAPGQELGYGLGVAIVEMGDRVALGHSGGGFGFLSDAYWLPDAGIGVVVLTNSTGHPAPVRPGPPDPPRPGRGQPPVEAPTLVVPVPETARTGAARHANSRYLYRPHRDSSRLNVEDGNLVLVRDDHKEPLRSAGPDELALKERPMERYRLLPDGDGEKRYLQELRSGLVWYRNKMGATGRSRHSSPVVSLPRGVPRPSVGRAGRRCPPGSDKWTSHARLVRVRATFPK